MTCKTKQENNGVCPHHNLQCGWPKCNGPEQEPWGACLSGRVFVGKLPEHVRKLAEDTGLKIQWLYTTPPQRKPLTPEQFNHMPELFVIPPHHVEMVVRAIEAAHGIKGDT